MKVVKHSLGRFLGLRGSSTSQTISKDHLLIGERRVILSIKLQPALTHSRPSQVGQKLVKGWAILWIRPDLLSAHHVEQQK